MDVIFDNTFYTLILRSVWKRKQSGYKRLNPKRTFRKREREHERCKRLSVQSERTHNITSVYFQFSIQ